ncbi:MAG TPA: prepilin-type N-terminal cleavage/methylation domain-containing protein [Pyrinomonadaceae bacterium]|nr:prepilin-type N-terminal cleavage/methylation domain-containing protein [Pyrinomonadaceae bacterium]
MKRQEKEAGFSLVELMIAMTVMLLALGIVSMVLSRAMAVKARESRTADALATAQAAISVLSREISNSGFGLYTDNFNKKASNGIVTAESNAHRIRVLSNVDHSGGVETDTDPLALRMLTPGEDVTYFFDATTSSIVRYDPHGVETSPGVYGPQTSVVVNRISNVTFEYFDYAGGTSQAVGPSAAPTVDTARVRITVDVELDQVFGQPNTQHVIFASDVTLRNNSYMLTQY